MLRLVICAVLLGVSTASAVATPPSDRIGEALRLSDFTVQALALPPLASALPQSFAVTVEFEDADVVLVLHRRTLRAPDFRLFAADDAAGTLTEITPPPSRTYRGEVLSAGSVGLSDDAVTASLSDTGLSAWIRRGGEVWAVQPVSDAVSGQNPSLHVVYRATDVIPGPESCGVTAMSAATPFVYPKVAIGNAICEVAFDCDREFYQANGSSVSSTCSDVENVLNGVEAIYENDVDITYLLTGIIVRTSEPDPYTTNDAGGLLAEFKTQWQQNHGWLRRDVAHLMTGKNIAGSTIGVAWLSVVCKPGAFGLSQSKYTGNFTNRVGLTAHELGHNWGSGHCSGGGCWIMCPGLGGCGGSVTKFAQVSKDAIDGYEGAQSCFGDDALPLPLPVLETFGGPSLDPTLWDSVGGAGVSTSASNEPTAPYSLNLDETSGVPDQIEMTALALAGQPKTLVKASTQHVGVENGESLFIEFWSTTGAWVVLDQLVSNGASQSQFVAHEWELPSDAHHDAFRLRLRAAVNQGNDDWYVDDLRIELAPPPPPDIFSIAPGNATAIGGTSVTLTGQGFSQPGVGFKVGSTQLLPFIDFFVVDDATVNASMPLSHQLGPVNVVGTMQGQESGAATVNYVPTDPPTLLAGQTILTVLDFKLTWADDPGDLAFLVVNLDGSTVNYKGTPMLNPLMFIPMPPLDGAGIGGLEVPAAGLQVGLTIHTQVLTIEPPGTDESTVELTNIKASTVAL